METSVEKNCSYNIVPMREVVTDTGGHDDQAQDTLQVQENPSYQISRASNARAEDQTTEYAEVTSSENRNMNINTNLAYDFNSATQSHDMTDDYQYVAVTDDSTYQPIKTHVETDSMYAVVIEETNQQNPAYLANTTHLETANMNKTSDEENGSTQPPTPEQIIAMSTLTVRTASTICSFWQGRVEVCTRLATIVVTLILMGILIATEATEAIQGVFLITGILLPIQLIAVVTMEILHLCIRIHRRRNINLKCFLTWDMIYCCITSFFSLMCLAASITIAVTLSTANIKIFVLLSIAGALYATMSGLLSFRTIWMRVTISKKWDPLVELHNYR